MKVESGLQRLLVVFAALLGPASSAALPAKPKGTLLLATNAIAFRSNTTETAYIGAEVYLHRRDINGFRLAQLIDVESGSAYALMSFPMSFGISAKVDDDMVDLSFDFHMDRGGARSVTYYSSKEQQTLHLPPRALEIPSSFTPSLDPIPDELRRRADAEPQHPHQHHQEEHHLQYLPQYLNSLEDPSTGVRLTTDLNPTISVTVQDACGSPLPTLNDLQLSCTPVRYGQTQGIESANSPYRGAAKWLWRATSSTRMHQISPGVFTGHCDMTNLAAAAKVHQACSKRMRDSGDGFQSLCHPLQAVLDLRRDLRYMLAHTYTGKYVAFSQFVASLDPVLAGYQRACRYYTQPEVQPRVDVQLAAEECGYPPEIALEVRGKDVSQMLGSMGAANGDFTATVTAKSVPTKGGCPR